MEVQLTDFENAAYSIFIVLLTRAILSFGINFYIPVSKVDENMKRAHVRDAVNQQKFYFKKNVFTRRWPPATTNGHGPINGGQSSAQTSRSHSRSSSLVGLDRNVFHHPNGRYSSSSQSPASSSRATSRCASPEGLPDIEDEYEEMTINEIVNGKTITSVNEDGTKASKHFPGLMGLVHSYLNSLNVDVATQQELAKYFDLIKRRADGEFLIGAAISSGSLAGPMGAHASSQHR